VNCVKTFTTLGLIAAIATAVGGAAQAKEQKPGGHSGTATHAVDPASLIPFALEATPAGGEEKVEFRSVQDMTPEDRQTISEAWTEIKNKATGEGFDFGRQGWTYEQIVSPAFREHVLLLFLRDDSPGDRSEFSAIVPRKGQERLRLIPILRRGYFPYSAPQENPVAMAAFNRSLASERAHEKPYWLSVSVSYAALNGAQAILSSAEADHGGNGPAGWLAAPSPSLHIEDDGEAVARFATEKAPGRFSEWELTFDKNGNLIKAVTSPIKAPELKVVNSAKLKSRRY